MEGRQIRKEKKKEIDINNGNSVIDNNSEDSDFLLNSTNVDSQE